MIATTNFPSINQSVDQATKINSSTALLQENGLIDTELWISAFDISLATIILLFAVLLIVAAFILSHALNSHGAKLQKLFKSHREKSTYIPTTSPTYFTPTTANILDIANINIPPLMRNKKRQKKQTTLTEKKEKIKKTASSKKESNAFKNLRRNVSRSNNKLKKTFDRVKSRSRNHSKNKKKEPSSPSPKLKTIFDEKRSGVL